MDFINITEENIDREHICCVMSDKKGENCIETKKNWMKKQFKNGLVFKKLNERGKIFIEYMSAENAWYPFEADGWNVIQCLWVAGRFKGQGIADALLTECINDSKSKGRKGIIALSANKKKPFLNDGDFLKHKGFKMADTAFSGFELLYLPFDENEDMPKIKQFAKTGTISDKTLTLYYTNQCPYTEKYVNLVKNIAEDRNVKMNIKRFDNMEEAQNSSCPFTTYSIFYNGSFVTNEILSEKKFIKFLDDNNL